MRRTIQRALIILFAGMALGLAANAISPRRIPYLTPPKPVLETREIVSLEEAQALWSGGAAFFLDARSVTDYGTGHIANAFSLPAEEFEEHYSSVAGMLTLDSSIVVYCDGVECDLSHTLARKLHELGYHNIRILVNGWTVWHTAGLPTHTGDQP